MAFANGKEILFSAQVNVNGYEKGKAEGIAEGIAEGKKAQYDEFWDIYQNKGRRSSYIGAFSGEGWTAETFKPKYNINPSYAVNLFSRSAISVDLVTLLKETGVTLDLSQATDLRYAFQLSAFKRVGVIDLSSINSHGGANYLFQNATSIETIDKLILTSSTSLDLTDAFSGCYGLRNIDIFGSINKDISFSSCINLTHDSLMSIIEALNYDIGQRTLTIGTANKKKLTAAEIAVATNKNWIVE